MNQPRIIDAHRDNPVRDLTSRELTLRSDTYDDDKRSVEAVLASENPVMVMDWDRGEIIEEVLVISDDMELARQVPLLDSHSRWSVADQLGSTRNLRIEKQPDGSRLIVGDRHLGDTERARDAAVMIRDGHLTDGSIGYRVTKHESVDPGKSITIGSRRFTNDGQRRRRYTTAWRIREDSLTPIGADEVAKMRSEPPHQPTHANPHQGRQAQKGHAMKFLKWLKVRGLSIDDLSADDIAAKRAEFEALTPEQIEQARAALAELEQREQAELNAQRNQSEPPAPSTDPSEAARAAIEQERQRVSAIRALAAEDVERSVIDTAIDSGQTVDEARAAVLKHIRSKRGGPSQINNVHERREDLARAVSDAMVIDASQQLVDDRGREVSDQARLRNAEDFRGIGLHDCARQVLIADSQRVPYDLDALYRAAVSNNNFSQILASTARRALVVGYNEAESTALLWVDQGEVNDFRDHTAVRMSAFSSLERVGSDGKVTHGSMADKGETENVATYARIFGVTRQTFINDDLGALTMVPMGMGGAAKRNIDDIVYGIFDEGTSNNGPTLSEDSKQLFSTTHAQSNLTTAALAAAALGSAKSLMRLHRPLKPASGEQGGPMNLRPAFLIVPSALEDTAAVLLNSRELNLAAAGDTDATTQRGNANPHFGIARLVSEGRLDAISSTHWFLAANPRQAPSIRVNYLRGQRTPVIERLPSDADLTISWRVYHDCGANAIDWRGIVKSTGAA